MSRLSPSDAALEGFKLARKEPGAILVWSLFYFGGIVVMGLVMLMGLGPGFIKFVQHGGMESGDIDAYVEVLEHSWPAFMLITLLAVYVISVVTAAIYRRVLRPQDGGIAYIRFGGDEIRLTLVNLILFSIGMLFLIFLTGFAAAVGGLLGVISGLGRVCFMIWVGVRLLLATAMTFAERRVAILDSWKLTEGQFWPLLGMTFLAIIFYLIVWLVFTIVSAGFVALAGGQTAMAHPTAMAPLVWFAVLVTLAVQLLLPVLQIVMIYSPLAEAYRELHDEPTPML